MWHDGVGEGWDRCALLPLADGWVLSGTARLAQLGLAAQAAYRIEVAPDWSVRRLHVRGTGDARSPEERALDLRTGGDGTWTADDEVVGPLSGVVDVALTFTPAALTPVIRRLGLDVGEEATVDVALVDHAAAAARRATHRLRRLAPDHYLHDPGDGHRHVHVGPQGLVTEYEDAWKAVATG